MFYWAQDSHNSACLSVNQQISSALPNITNMYVLRISHAEHANQLTLGSQSPSVYVVFPSITAFDGCHQVGKAFTNLTTSFAPEAMSTVRSDGSYHPFNFTDLPCPPADIPWDPSTGPYKPLLGAPNFLFSIDPAFSTCTPAASQGIDPYIPLKRNNKPSPPRMPFCNPGKC